MRAAALGLYAIGLSLAVVLGYVLADTEPTIIIEHPLAVVATVPYDGPIVGGTLVQSGLDCEEDEAIWWLGVDSLGCVHFEEVR
ncbi:MAG: hypothetical protein V3R71_06110 [Gemmatimonadales bacterium]